MSMKVGEVVMIREYIIKISDEIMEEEIADRPQELVRCKDCKHQNWVNAETGCIVCKFGRGTNAPDWFCADGEKRNEE